MAVQKVLVKLTWAWEVIRHGREPWPWDMDAAGRPMQDHNLRMRVAHPVVPALGTGPFHPAVGSFCLMGQAMHWFHWHGMALAPSNMVVVYG
jgi:hypothetical protein